MVSCTLALHQMTKRLFLGQLLAARGISCGHALNGRTLATARHALAPVHNTDRACRDALQRTILPLIANELLQHLHDESETSPESMIPDSVASARRHEPSPVPSKHSVSADSSSCHNRDGLWRLGLRAHPSTPGLEALATGVERSGRSAGLSSVIRSRSDLFLATAAMLEGSMHGRSRMRRRLSTDLMQAGEQVKAARCAVVLIRPLLSPATVLHLVRALM